MSMLSPIQPPWKISPFLIYQFPSSIVPVLMENQIKNHQIGKKSAYFSGLREYP